MRNAQSGSAPLAFSLQSRRRRLELERTIGVGIIHRGNHDRLPRIGKRAAADVYSPDDGWLRTVLLTGAGEIAEICMDFKSQLVTSFFQPAVNVCADIQVLKL